MQIRLAISNLDPKPARLDRNWNTPYSMTEAVEGFRRTASRYGWKGEQPRHTGKCKFSARRSALTHVRHSQCRPT